MGNGQTVNGNTTPGEKLGDGKTGSRIGSFVHWREVSWGTGRSLSQGWEGTWGKGNIWGQWRERIRGIERSRGQRREGSCGRGGRGTRKRVLMGEGGINLDLAIWVALAPVGDPTPCLDGGGGDEGGR